MHVGVTLVQIGLLGRYYKLDFIGLESLGMHMAFVSLMTNAKDLGI